MKSRFHSKAFKTFICFSIKQKKFEFLAKSDKKIIPESIMNFFDETLQDEKVKFFYHV